MHSKQSRFSAPVQFPASPAMFWTGTAPCNFNNRFGVSSTQFVLLYLIDSVCKEYLRDDDICSAATVDDLLLSMQIVHFELHSITSQLFSLEFGARPGRCRCASQCYACAQPHESGGVVLEFLAVTVLTVVIRTSTLCPVRQQSEARASRKHMPRPAAR